jgi:hypothetical protein
LCSWDNQSLRESKLWTFLNIFITTSNLL